MQRINKYKFQKNFSILFILVTGFVYSVFLYLLNSKFLPEFFYNLKLVEHYSNDLEYLIAFCTSAEFYAVGILGLLAIVLDLKFFWATVSSIQKILRTLVFQYAQRTELVEIAGQSIHSVRSNQIFAYTAGFFSPKIYLSTKLLRVLTKSQKLAVIQHELAHKSNFDPLVGTVVEFWIKALPTLPYKKIVFQNFVTLCELYADSKAIAISSTKTHLFAAMEKLMRYSDPHMRNMAMFGLGFRASRLSILLGRDRFDSIRYFGAICGLLTISLLGVFGVNLLDIFNHFCTI